MYSSDDWKFYTIKFKAYAYNWVYWLIKAAKNLQSNVLVNLGVQQKIECSKKTINRLGKHFVDKIFMCYH